MKLMDLLPNLLRNEVQSPVLTPMFLIAFVPAYSAFTPISVSKANTSTYVTLAKASLQGPDLYMRPLCKEKGSSSEWT